MENFKRTVNEYEANSLLKSLHSERKKRKTTEVMKNTEKAEVMKNPEEESKKVIFSDGSSVFMSPLNFISPEPPNFLTFRQLLYEDLQNIPNRKKTLISAVFTSFCIENQFFQPVLKSGIKVLLVVNNSVPQLKKISENFTVISPKLLDK